MSNAPYIDYIETALFNMVANCSKKSLRGTDTFVENVGGLLKTLDRKFKQEKTKLKGFQLLALKKNMVQVYDSFCALSWDEEEGPDNNRHEEVLRIGLQSCLRDFRLPEKVQPLPGFYYDVNDPFRLTQDNIRVWNDDGTPNLQGVLKSTFRIDGYLRVFYNKAMDLRERNEAIGQPFPKIWADVIKEVDGRYSSKTGMEAIPKALREHYGKFRNPVQKYKHDLDIETKKEFYGHA